MDDKALIGYCRLHSETPRALFNHNQINRMLELAGSEQRVESGWHAVHSDQMHPICDLAEKRMNKPKLTIVR